jgi:hypothetical protein
MVLDATQVRIGISGQLYKAPLGSTAPTDATSVLAAAYTGLGYVHEDGVTENWDDSSENIIAWQNATTVRAVTSESTAMFELTLIQTSAAVLTAFHRGSTITEPSPGVFRMDVKPTVNDPSAWVFDVLDGTKHIRIYLGNAEVTERGEVTYSNGGDPIGYPLTITAYPDVNGNLMTKFSDDIAWDPTP